MMQNPDLPGVPYVPGMYLSVPNLSTSEVVTGNGDPIAILRDACERIGRQPRPDQIAMHEQVWNETERAFQAWKKWALKIVGQRSLLSGRYGKRRSQRKRGVAAKRRWDLRMAREWLSDKDGQG